MLIWATIDDSTKEFCIGSTYQRQRTKLNEEKLHAPREPVGKRFIDEFYLFRLPLDFDPLNETCASLNWRRSKRVILQWMIEFYVLKRCVYVIVYYILIGDKFL